MLELVNTFMGHDWMASTATQAVAWALIHFLWQGTLVALILRSLLAGLPPGLSNWRYGVSLAALLLMAVLPMATAWQHLSRPAPGAQAPSVQGAGEAATAMTAPRSLTTTTSMGRSPQADLGVPAEATGTLPSMLLQARRQLHPHLPWVLTFWLCGVLLFSVQQLLAWRRVQLLVRHGEGPEASLQTVLSGLMQRLGVRQSVQVLSSRGVSVPTVIGALKPVILVPLGTLTRLSSEEVEMILAHELAHVRRYDYSVNLLQVAIETLLFYHPAVWWVSAQIRREREHCCDDLAVHLWGDSPSYARALLHLEEARCSPQLAMAANGTPLLDRVRRLVGASTAPQQGIGSTALAGGLSLAILGVVIGWTHPVMGGHGVPGDVVAPTPPPVAERPAPPTVAPMAPPALRPPAAVAPPAPPSPRGPRAPAPPIMASTALLTLPMALSAGDGFVDGDSLPSQGRFTMERRWQQIALQLRGDSSRRSFSVHTTLDGSAFTATSWTTAGRATLEREAGSLIFEGNFSAPGEGSGTFRFEPSSTFRRDMASRGYDDLSPSRQFELALHDVTTDLVDDMASFGFDDLSLERLVELAIHRVDGDFIRAFEAVGYRNLEIQTWLEFKIHDVSTSYVEAMVDMGYRDIPAERLVELHIHDVDPEFIRSVKAMGFDDLPTERLIELSIHDVDAEFMESMAAMGYDDMPVEALIEFSIHDVDPKFVEAMADAGYRNLPAERLVELSIHDVDPEFVAAMAEAGYSNLPVERLVEMAIHDVSPRLVRALEDAGYRNLSAERLVEMSIHDVDAELIDALSTAGYGDLPVERLIEFSIHDVTPEFIGAMANLGYNDLSAQELVEFRIFDVSPRYIQRLQENGENSLTPQELVQRRIHGSD